MGSGSFAWCLAALVLVSVSPEQHLQHSSILVLGFLAGYEPQVTRKVVNGFFGSLRRSGFEGHQVLLHDGGSGSCEQEEFWAMYKLRCFSFRQLDYTFSGTLASAHSSPWMRFFYWQQYLQSHTPEEVTHVLIADTRDVYFQRDLFRHLQSGGAGSLFFFAEDTRVFTGENLVFVDSCVECLAGRKLQKLSTSVGGGASCWKFASLPMLNLGTIFGTTTAVTSFCAELIRKMGDSGYACWDNFIFAEMVWQGSMFQNSSVFFSEQGAVCTMEFAYVNREGEVVNSKGRICAAVHMFDRFPELQALYDSVYAIEGLESNLSARQVKLKLKHLGVPLEVPPPCARFRSFNGFDPASPVCTSPHRLSRPCPGTACYRRAVVHSLPAKPRRVAQLVAAVRRHERSVPPEAQTWGRRIGSAVTVNSLKNGKSFVDL